MTQIRHIPIEELSKHNKNPRTITEKQFKNLKSRMEDDPDFFDLRPCLVNHVVDSGKLIIYAGNQRFEAAKSLGWKSIPCIVEKDLDENVVRSRMVADNLHHGAWDTEMLANEFDDLPLSEMGYDVIVNEENNSIVEPQNEEKKEEKINCPMCGK